jgi:hypothetical protein
MKNIQDNINHTLSKNIIGDDKYDNLVSHFLFDIADDIIDDGYLTPNIASLFNHQFKWDVRYAKYTK